MDQSSQNLNQQQPPLDNMNSQSQITFDTIKYLVEDNYTVPLLIDIDNIQDTINKFFQVEEETQEERVIQYKKTVKLTNAILASQMINTCHLFQKYIKVKPKLSWKELQESIQCLIFQDIEQIILDRQIPALITQSGTFLNKCMKLALTLIQSFRKCLESIIELLTYNEFDHNLLNDFLESIIENEVGRICLNFKEFSFVQQADFIILFEKIKETVHMLVQDVQIYFYKMSLFSTRQMKMLDKLFEENSALINVRTFQTIQVEVAKYIFEQIQSYFLVDASNFWRDEFTPNQQNFAKSALVNFYSYSEEKLQVVPVPHKTGDFQTCFQRLGIEFQHQVKWVQIMLTSDDERLQRVWDHIRIISIQDAIYKSNRNEGKILSCDNSQQYFMTKFEGIYLIFVVKQSDLYEILSDSIDQVNTSLKDYLSLKITNNQENMDLNKIDEEGKSRHSEVRLRMQDNILFEVSELTHVDGTPVNQGDRMYPFRKLTKPQGETPLGPTGGGGPTDGGMATTMLAGGVLGAGIGMLLVDSLDKKMPWNVKLQRAGVSTLGGSAYGIIAIQMPVIGLLIAQTYLFMNLHSVLNNPVLDTKNKLKKIGHFGVQSGLGIGSAIAGQILIPIPFLGAIIGGTIGGISAGLYAKFVVANTRSSIINMLLRIEKNLSETGQIILTKDIFENMRISSDHFYGHRPDVVTLNDWLTLALVNLVNEVHYLFTLRTNEEIQDLHKELEIATNGEKHEELRMKLITKEQELENVEKLSIKYEASRDYLERNNVSILKYAFEVNLFVQGMIDNFKI